MMGQAFVSPARNMWRPVVSTAAAKLKKLGQRKLTSEEKKMRRRALKDRNLPSFQQHIQEQ